MWAGIAKLAAQVDGARLGSMNPQIYTLGALEDETASGVRDVTIGNNSFNGVTGFNAVVGYDQATGWGSVDMATFVNAFTSSNGATPTPTPAPVSGPMTVMPVGMSFGLHKLGTVSKARIVTVVNPKRNKQTITLSSITTTGNRIHDRSGDDHLSERPGDQPGFTMQGRGDLQPFGDGGTDQHLDDFEQRSQSTAIGDTARQETGSVERR